MKQIIYQYSRLASVFLLFMLLQQYAHGQIRIKVHPRTIQSYIKVDNDSDNREDYVCRTVVNGIEITPAYAWQVLFNRNVAHELTQGQENHEPYQPIAYFIENAVPQIGFEVDSWEHEETPRALYNGDDKGFAEADYTLSLIPSSGNGVISIPPNSNMQFTRNIRSSKSNFDITYQVNWYIEKGSIYRDGGGSLEMCDGETDKILIASTPALYDRAFQQYFRWEVKENGVVYIYEQELYNSNNAAHGMRFDLAKHLDAVPMDVQIRTIEVKMASFTRHFNNAMLSNGYTETRIIHVHKTPIADPSIFTPEGARCWDAEPSILINKVTGGAEYYFFAIRRLSDGRTGGADLWADDEYPVRIYGGIFGDSETFPPGDYEVAIIDKSPAGCATNASVKTIITMPERPAKIRWAGSKTDETCTDKKDGEIVLGATGGIGEYKYYYQDQLVQDRLTGLSPGDYPITIRDKNYLPDEPGCEATTTVSILTAPPMDLSKLKIETTQVSCRSASDGVITINTGNPGPFEYRLRDAAGQTTVRDWQTVNSFADLPFGTGRYKVDIRNQNHCEYSEDVVLQPPPLLKAEVLVKQQVSCYGYNDGAIEVKGVGGATGQYRFSIDEGQFTNYMKASELFAGLEGGRTYSVRVQDINACTSEPATVNIQQPGAPVGFTLMVEPDHCGQPADGSVSVTLNGGTAPYFYILSETEQPRQVVPSNDGKHTVALEDLAEGNYSIKVRDVNGCTNINRDPWLEINAHVDQASDVEVFYLEGDIAGPSCQGPAEGQITVRARGGSPAYSFSDNGVDYVQSSTGDYYTFTHVPVGVAVTFYAKDANQCNGMKQVTIPAYDLSVEVSEKVDTECNGTDTGKVTLRGNGGTPPYQYAQDDNDYVFSNVFSELPPGTHTFYIKDSQGCLAETTATISMPSLDLGGPMSVCSGQTVTLAPGLPGEYLWTSSNGFRSTSSSVSLQEPGEYHLTITNPDGCNFSDSFILMVSADVLQADLLMADSAAVGQTVIGIDLTSPEPEERQWTYDETKIQHSVEAQFYNTFVFSEAGTYTIELQAKLASCEDSYVHTMTIYNEGDKGGNSAGRENTDVETVIRKFSVYPNPAKDKLNVLVSLSEKQDIQLSLINTLTGHDQLVTGSAGEDTYHVKIELPQLVPGLYFLKLVTKDDQRKVVQVMIVR